MLISIFVALCIRKSEENKIERYVGFFPFSIEEFFRFCQDFRKQLVNELLWVLSNVIESMKDKPAFHFENMTHKKQYDNAIPSSTDCNRYPRNDLELYNNHAENDRIFNPRTNHKVHYWKVH